MGEGLRKVVEAHRRAEEYRKNRARAVRVAERAVLQAAEDFREWQGSSMELDMKSALIAAVDALREARK